MKKITLQLILFLIVSSNPIFGKSDLTKGLVGYYKMDEGDGEVLINYATGTDIMPDGVIYNPVWSDTSVLGTSLYFDIVQNLPDELPSFVDFGTYDPAQGGGKFTFSCWIYWNGTNGEYQGITGKRTDWTNELVYWDVCLKRDGPFQFEAVGPEEVKQLVLSDFSPDIRKWQNFTVTYDGTTATMYLDSKLLKQGQMQLGLKKDAAFMLGCAEPLGVTPFTGHIDEVRYYNRPITNNEVKSLYEYPTENTSSKILAKNTTRLFPNPVVGELEITGENLNKIRIFNCTGKLVFEQNVSGNFVKINSSKLKPGVYFINASGKEDFFGKFIKK